MLESLDRESNEPLYLQIRNQIRKLILAGDLPAGTRLPPERELAARLGVNRTTVANAYDELTADGLVEGHVGRGTIVSALPRAGRITWDKSLSAPFPWSEYLAAVGQQVRDPLIRELVSLCAREDVISLAAGVPAPDLYPIERFAQATDRVLRRDGRALLQHCPTEGHPAFRETLATLAFDRGFTTSPENILVIAGSQQGLDLVTRLLIEPGDVVVVEVPSYLGALIAFRAAGARLLGVPMDDEGMRPDVLVCFFNDPATPEIYTLPPDAFLALR